MADTQRAAMQQALEALESLQGGCTDSGDGTTEAITVWCPEVITVLRAALAEQDAEQAEPVAVPAPIVAGAIFDFAGFLTVHKRVIKVGSTANASPVVERIKEWAGLRGLPLDNADVLSWQKNTAPPAPARQEWQPIETAPRAGNVIVAAPMEAGGYYVEEAWFSEDSDQWWPANVDPTDAHGSPIYPTLWQPLPAAPITAAPAEGGAAALTQPEGGA